MGYKRYGYLALCISYRGLHARAVVKAEADGRTAIAETLKTRSWQLTKDFQASSLARYDKWDFFRLPAGQRVDPASGGRMRSTIKPFPVPPQGASSGRTRDRELDAG
jgi:hypothetical protein